MDTNSFDPNQDPPVITPNADPTLESTIESIEKDLLIEIMDEIQNNKMSTADAQTLAQKFLALLPITDKHDLLKKLRNLGEESKEVKYVYNTYASTLDEEKRQQTLETMRQHIKSGNIEHAIQVAKSAYVSSN